MPFSSLKDLGAEWFLRSLRHQDLQNYCEGLAKALSEEYYGDASRIAITVCATAGRRNRKSLVGWIERG